ncbi:hypothetical protein L873DRAFT_306286 [Choiromyces venosus 120613-1]|uniref:Uncharacterized protein n=1 Tax=Choiromyces venosus 120613-1 TaxID=1336337 RepID=A0A3N4J046_9PEZI|nr:hypothetical protein L873DRAFT_306286 [Choiromyces venosus 120613-1]
MRIATTIATIRAITQVSASTICSSKEELVKQVRRLRISLVYCSNGSIHPCKSQHGFKNNRLSTFHDVQTKEVVSLPLSLTPHNLIVLFLSQ